MVRDRPVEGFGREENCAPVRMWRRIRNPAIWLTVTPRVRFSVMWENYFLVIFFLLQHFWKIKLHVLSSVPLISFNQFNLCYRDEVQVVLNLRLSSWKKFRGKITALKTYFGDFLFHPSLSYSLSGRCSYTEKSENVEIHVFHIISNYM